MGKLFREGSKNVKQKFESLIQGNPIRMEIDERIVYDQLTTKKNAVRSPLLASGYLKVLDVEFEDETGHFYYSRSTLTNREVCTMFDGMILDWFTANSDYYNDFVKALFLGDIDTMNLYMNRVALTAFGSFHASNEARSSLLELGDCPRTSSTDVGFDAGKKPSEEAEPEKFYHSFVPGLMVDLANRYVITSSRESGFRRYDVQMEPKDRTGDAIIIEFKVNNPKREKNPEDIVQPHCSRLKGRGMRPCCWTRNSQWNKCKSAALRSLKNRC